MIRWREREAFTNTTSVLTPVAFIETALEYDSANPEMTRFDAGAYLDLDPAQYTWFPRCDEIIQKGP